jgi:hypothetical protein
MRTVWYSLLVVSTGRNPPSTSCQTVQRGRNFLSSVRVLREGEVERLQKPRGIFSSWGDASIEALTVSLLEYTQTTVLMRM